MNPQVLSEAPRTGATAGPPVLDLALPSLNAEGMAAVDEPPVRSVLTLGRVDVVRIQVGYRARPDGPAYQQFLLDVPVPRTDADDADPVDQDRVLSALEPALYVGGGTARHYS